jgi:osmotically-inducible protein OsmY
LQVQHVNVETPLRIDAAHGVVTISGIVPSLYQRQLILALARRVAGVHSVNDQLEVRLPPAFPATKPVAGAESPRLAALGA